MVVFFFFSSFGVVVFFFFWSGGVFLSVFSRGCSLPSLFYCGCSFSLSFSRGCSPLRAAAAGDAPTVTRHAVEHREVVVVPVSSGFPLQAGSGEGVSAPSNPVPNLPKPTVGRAQPSSAAVESSHHSSGERVDSSGSGGDVLMEVAQAVEPTTKSHAPVEEHDESLVPKRQRAPRDALLAKSGITRIHSWMSRLRRTPLQTFAEMSTETYRIGLLCIKQIT